MTLDDRSLREHLDRRAEAGVSDVEGIAEVVMSRVAVTGRSGWWRGLGVRGPSLGVAAAVVVVVVVALAVVSPGIWPGPGTSSAPSGTAPVADYPANRVLTAAELGALLGPDPADRAGLLVLADVELQIQAELLCPAGGDCPRYLIDFGERKIYVYDPSGKPLIPGPYAFRVRGEPAGRLELVGPVRPGPDGLAWTLSQLLEVVDDIRSTDRAVPYLFLVDAARAVSAAAISCPSVPGPTPSPDFGCVGSWTWLIGNEAAPPITERFDAPPDSLRLPNAVDGRPETTEHGYWLVDPLVAQEPCFACPPAGAADLIGRVPTAGELGLAPSGTSVAPTTGPTEPTTGPTPTGDASETGVREITFSTDLVRLDGFETADLTVTVSFADDVVPYFGADASLTPLLYFQRDAGDTGDLLDPHIAQLVRTMRESPVAGLWTATIRLTSGDRGIWHVDGLVAYEADGQELHIGPAIRDLSPKLEVIGTSPPQLTMEVSPSPVEIGQALELSGQVTDQDTGEPLRDVVVTIGQGDACNLGGTGTTVTTNPNGAYSYVIDEVVHATVCAWISDEPGVHPSPDSDIPIALYGILFADSDGIR